MIVAIDGPAGAGKSTLATMLAERLGFQLIETGALYRAVGKFANERGIAWSDEPALAAVAHDLEVAFEFDNGVNRTLVNGEDLTAALREEWVSDAASRVSSVQKVRDTLLSLQRDLGRATDSVMEGRDIGTVVFPDADAKFFVTAEAKERARRRVEQLKEAGEYEDTSYEVVLRDIEERDRRDRERETAPLLKAEDAILIDTTELSAEQAMDKMLRVIEASRSEKA
jgi:cytidylate kinase